LPQPTEWWSRVPQVQAVEALAPAQWLLWVKLGHSAMSAQCPVCPKAGWLERSAPRELLTQTQPADVSLACLIEKKIACHLNLSGLVNQAP
jgi:hypothetical protein